MTDLVSTHRLLNLLKAFQIMRGREKKIRYHRSCRQLVIKRRCKSSGKTEDPGFCSPPKIGRPSLPSSSSDKTPVKRTSLRRPEAPKLKEVKCAFRPIFCKWKWKAELHRVYSENRGQELINIKNTTLNDAVRAALSHLPDDEPKKAAALELHRTCNRSQVDSNSTDRVDRLCDLEILMHLQSCICNEPFRTNMTSLNKKYLEIRRKNNAR